MSVRKFGLVALSALCVSGAAWAQLTPAAKMALASANQLGILEYCHDHGLAGADALAAERRAFESGPSSNLSTVRTQTLGRQGFSVAPDGDQITIAELARRQATTVAALCKDLADSSLQFEAEMNQAAQRRTTPATSPGPR